MPHVQHDYYTIARLNLKIRRLKPSRAIVEPSKHNYSSTSFETGLTPQGAVSKDDGNGNDDSDNNGLIRWMRNNNRAAQELKFSRTPRSKTSSAVAQSHVKRHGHCRVKVQLSCHIMLRSDCHCHIKVQFNCFDTAVMRQFETALSFLLLSFRKDPSP